MLNKETITDAKLSINYQKERYLCFSCKHLKTARIFTVANASRPEINCGKWFVGGFALDVCDKYEETDTINKPNKQ